MPRVAQHEDVLFALYNPPWGGFPDFLFPPRTHAYFPYNLMDASVNDVARSGWVTGAVGGGYVGLYTANRNVTWLPVPESPGGMELMADGVGQAAWICVVGTAAAYGSFAKFTAYVQGAVVTSSYANATVVASAAFPDGRSYSFGWDEPFVVNGVDAPLSGFSRLDSVYAKVRECCRARARQRCLSVCVRMLLRVRGGRSFIAWRAPPGPPPPRRRSSLPRGSTSRSAASPSRRTTRRGRARCWSPARRRRASRRSRSRRRRASWATGAAPANRLGRGGTRAV